MGHEVIPVSVSPGVSLDRDEDVFKLKAEKVAGLKPSFERDGTITAANASKLNDGAAASVLTSDNYAKRNGLRPMARIVSFADYAASHIDFSTAPRGAVEIALKRAKLTVKDIHYWEINEAFGCVPLVNARLLGLDLSRVNVDGGAVAMGHPIGMSGARVVGALARILKQRDAQFGVATICNGGGGSTAIVIEAL